MVESVSLARARRQPHHFGRYAVQLHQANERASEPNRRGIQFGSFAFDGPSVFGKCVGHDRSCAIPSQAVGRFSGRFPPRHSGAQLTLGAIHHKQILYVDDQAAHYVATLTWPSVGVKPNTWKSWGFGVLRDSRTFRARQQDPKHLALGCSWCHWKGLEA